MTFVPDLARRRLLATGSGAFAVAGLTGVSRAVAQTAAPAPAAASQAKPLPAYVAWKDADSMIVHTPTTIETKRTALGSSGITPTDRLFIRNNLPAPDASIVANRDAWQLSVEGVREPRTLTVGELKTLGLETIATVLQCSGNGRGYFPTKPAGTRWGVGAAGCVVWSGVPLRSVVQTLGGPVNGVRFITGTGGEKLPDGIDPKTVIVERSVPMTMLDDALLAWEMNGEPLPHAHGGPLRLIVPGYSGVNNVKYIKRLAFTRDETDAAIQRTGYRMQSARNQGRSKLSAGVGNGSEVVDQFTGAGGRPDQGAVGFRSMASRWVACRPRARSRFHSTAARRGEKRVSSARTLAAMHGGRSYCKPS